MTTAELKNNLHELIVETNDLTVLNQIKDYFTQLKQGQETSNEEAQKQNKKMFDDKKEG